MDQTTACGSTKAPEPAGIVLLRREVAALEKAQQILAGTVEVESFEPEEVEAFRELMSVYVRPSIMLAGSVLCAQIRPLRDFAAFLIPADEGVLLLIRPYRTAQTAADSRLFNGFSAALQALAETVFDTLTRFHGALPVKRGAVPQ